MCITAGPPANVLPFTTVVFGCQSAGAKTGVVGRLAYHVHTNDTAAALPGWQTEPVRVMVSWATPYFGIPTCTSEIVAAPSLGRTGSSHDDKSPTEARVRPLTVLRAATNDDHNEVTFVLHRQRASGSNSSLFDNSSISSIGNIADLSHDEVSPALRAMDTVAFMHTELLRYRIKQVCSLSTQFGLHSSTLPVLRLKLSAASISFHSPIDQPP